MSLVVDADSGGDLRMAALNLRKSGFKLRAAALEVGELLTERSDESYQIRHRRTFRQSQGTRLE